MKNNIVQFFDYASAEKFQDILNAAGIDAEVRYLEAGNSGVLASGSGLYCVFVDDPSREKAERILEEKSCNKIFLEGVGEFSPSQTELLTIEHFMNINPDLSDRDLLLILFLLRSITIARDNQNRRASSPHVSAQELLSAAPFAALDQFGAAPRRWLTGLGLVSSSAIGAEIYRFIGMGIFCEQPGDSIEDFNIKSDYDSFLNEEEA